MGVGGVVVLYHPAEEVIANIQSYLPYLDTLYIADNTEGALSAVAKQLRHLHNVIVIADGENKGIATRLNHAARLAIDKGYNWLLTMDQDSRFEADDMQRYLLCAGSYAQKSKTAMFGVEYEQFQQAGSQCTPVEKNRLITSGSIVNLNLFRGIGGFEEKLFIDDVDFDYCYRARKQGYLVVQFANILLTHQLGKSSYHTSLKTGRKTHRSLHSPKRMYYMTRNFLYVNSKYGKTSRTI